MYQVYLLFPRYDGCDRVIGTGSFLVGCYQTRGFAFAVADGRTGQLERHYDDHGARVIDAAGREVPRDDEPAVEPVAAQPAGCEVPF